MKEVLDRELKIGDLVYIADSRVSDSGLCSWGLIYSDSKVYHFKDLYNTPSIGTYYSVLKENIDCKEKEEIYKQLSESYNSYFKEQKVYETNAAIVEPGDVYLSKTDTEFLYLGNFNLKVEIDEVSSYCVAGRMSISLPYILKHHMLEDGVFDVDLMVKKIVEGRVWKLEHDSGWKSRFPKFKIFPKFPNIIKSIKDKKNKIAFSKPLDGLSDILELSGHKCLVTFTQVEVSEDEI